MRVNAIWMASKFKELNNKFFNNELPTPIFEIGKSYRAYGRCYFIKRKYHKIQLSVYFDRSEKAFEQTLLHEMIHLYFNNKGMLTEHHGRNFQAKAREFDKYGYNIHTTTTEEHKGKIQEERIMIKFVDGDNKIFLFSCSENKLKYFKNLISTSYKALEVFTTTNAKFGGFPKRRNTIRGYKMEVAEWEKEYKPLMTKIY